MGTNQMIHKFYDISKSIITDNIPNKIIQLKIKVLPGYLMKLTVQYSESTEFTRSLCNEFEGGGLVADAKEN